jgi:hypothetical protein
MKPQRDPVPRYGFSKAQPGSSNRWLPNPAFLQEIKEESIHYSELLRSVAQALSVEATIRPRMLAELLGRLRDELETYFALEEFYGYLPHNADAYPEISREAEHLKSQHAPLFVQLNTLVDQAERLVYHESPGRSTDEIIAGFFDFYAALREHEQREMELAMRFHNEEVGVGD